MELVSLKGAPRAFKEALLKALEYDVDKEGFVLNSKGEKVFDSFADKLVRIENVAIFPHNSPAVVLDDNPLSIASYLEEHEELA